MTGERQPRLAEQILKCLEDLQGDADRRDANFQELSRRCKNGMTGLASSWDEAAESIDQAANILRDGISAFRELSLPLIKALKEIEIARINARSRVRVAILSGTGGAIAGALATYLLR